MRAQMKIAAGFIAVLLILLLLILLKVFLLQKLNIFPEDRTVLTGVWTEGFWDNNTKTLNVQKIQQFEKDIHEKVTIANFYEGWDELEDPPFAQNLQTISAHGWIPMISTNPYLTNKCDFSQEDIYATIVAGKCDVLIQNIARVVHSFGKPLFFRFAWEANVDSNAWSIQATYSSSESFIAAWRHVHEIFSREGVKNVRWVFSVNVPKANSISIASLYPGDAYVDWTGIDGYNWGTTQSWSHWTSFDETFHSTYQQILAVAPTKPLMISEFNSASQGGDKSKWFADALNSQIPNHYPKIQAIIFFNDNKMSSEGVDWRIETSPSVLRTVSASLRNQIYTSSVKNLTN